jgi:hypothetical protein
MSGLARKTALIFGGSLTPTNNIEAYASKAVGGSPVWTNDPAVIQTASWLQGLSVALTTGQAPYLEDHNGLYYVLSYQLAYLLERGIPEWDSGTTYNTNDFCRSGNAVYVSKIDSNTNNAVSNTNDWQTFQSTLSILTSQLSGYLQAAQFPALTGDVTTSAGSVNTTLASITSSGSAGAANSIPVISIDAKGRVTSLSSATPSIPATELTGTLQAAQMPALNGDVSSSAGSLTTTLASVNSNPGTVGSSTQIPVIVSDAKGRITATGVASPSVNASSQLTGTLQAAQMPALNGDVSSSAGSLTTTLASVNSNPGTVGSSTQIPVIVSDAKGRITATGVAAPSVNASSQLTGTLQAGQMPALTGDVTTPGGSLATTLASVNPNPGTYGDSTDIPVFSVDSKGRITGITTTPIPPGILAKVVFFGQGTIGTNMPIYSQYNVTQVYKVGTGQYTLTFANGLPTDGSGNGIYGFSGSCGSFNGNNGSNGDNNIVVGGLPGYTGVRTEFNLTVWTWEANYGGGGILEDSQMVSVIVF